MKRKKKKEKTPLLTSSTHGLKSASNMKSIPNSSQSPGLYAYSPHLHPECLRLQLAALEPARNMSAVMLRRSVQSLSKVFVLPEC